MKNLIRAAVAISLVIYAVYFFSSGSVPEGDVAVERKEFDRTTALEVDPYVIAPGPRDSSEQRSGVEQSSAGLRQVSVTVRTASGEAVEGATISAVLLEEEALSSKTGADGTAVLAAAPTGDFELTAMHPEFAAESVICGSGQTSVSITLHANSNLRGRVVWINGEPVGSGALVVATDLSVKSSISRPLVRLGAEPLHGRSVVETGPGGSFEFTGLTPGHTYSVASVTDGGYGFDQENHTLGIEGGREALITLSPIYALRLIIRDELGAEIRCNRRLNFNKNATSVHTPEGYSRVFGRDSLPFARLLGAAAGLYEAGERSDERLILISSDGERGESVEFAIEVELPGYSKGSFLCTAFPIGSRLRAANVNLQTSADSFGSVRVQAFGACPDLVGPFDGSVRMGTLYLRDQANFSRSFSIDIYRPVAQPVVIDGIPSGRYAASMKSLDWPTDNVPAQIDITDGGVAEYAFNVPERGAVVLEPAVGDNIPYRGRLTMTVRGPDPGDGFKVRNLVGPDYSMEGLPVGVVRMKVKRAPGLPGAVGKEFSVTVDPCGITVAALPLSP